MPLAWVALSQHPEISPQRKGQSDMARLAGISVSQLCWLNASCMPLSREAWSSLLHFPSSFARALGREGPGEWRRRGGYSIPLAAQLALAAHHLCTDAFLPIWMPPVTSSSHVLFLVQWPCPALLEGPLLYFPLTSQALVMISQGEEVAF